MAIDEPLCTRPKDVSWPCGVMDPTSPPCATAESVLREHVAFLKEQLAEKNSWLQQALDQERAENSRLRDRIGIIDAKREKYRVALGETVRELLAFIKDASNHELDQGEWNSWNELVGGNS